MVMEGWKGYKHAIFKLEKAYANTVFVCPNGHEPCAINPSGYQWFDLTKEDTD
ncbi:MAG: hypothetical protein CM1200mP13_17550 [Candidatus Pelagibacterales bacterium]|nr:MAG: hypothetical protein CM1200mP13_17550 [Pelagibacterales bacterium]